MKILQLNELLNDPKLSMDRVPEIRQMAIDSTQLPTAADAAAEDGAPTGKRRRMQCNETLVEV